MLDTGVGLETNIYVWNIMRQLNIFIFVNIFISFIVPTTFADYIEPGKVTVTTEKYPVSLDSLKTSGYVYDLSWQGIPVGSAQIEVEEKNSGGKSTPMVNIKAEAKSAKVIDLVYRLRHHSESTINKSTFQPVEFQTWQTENSKIKAAKVSFGTDGKIQSVIEKDGKVDKQSEFVSNNFTLDPISAAFFARSIPIVVGAKALFDVFNGKHRYLIEFNVVALEEIEIMGTKRKAFKTVPTVKKLTDTEGETRLSEASIWISADESRQVLKLESKVFVGSVGATLVKVDDKSTNNVKLALTR